MVYVMSRVRGKTYVSSLHTLLFCSGLRHKHTKGTNGSHSQSIYELTEPSRPMMSDDVSDKDRLKHRELRPLLFLNSVWVRKSIHLPLSYKDSTFSSVTCSLTH